MTQSPQPGEILTGESVKLLKAGDVVLFPGSMFKTKRGLSKSQDRIARVDRLTDTHVKFDDGGGWALSNPEPWGFAFIGRPDPEGWMPHDGGPNPVGDETRIDVRCRNGLGSGITNAGDFRWTHTGAPDDIITFRLAAPSVERGEISIIDEATQTHPGMFSAPPEPDVAGARERLETEADFAGASDSTWVLVEDLRLILSTYDRQADEIQRQGEDIERLRGALDYIASDRCVRPKIVAARARQGGPEHG